METPDQYMHRAIKCDRAVAGTSADGIKRSFMDGAQRSPKGEEARKRAAESTLNPLFPAEARGCRPAPCRADARSTAFGFAPKPPSGGFSPPVPQGSGGRSAYL
jgi:hypothetical protein